MERSYSPWLLAIVLVKKKDGTQRFCVNYQALNDITINDSYPLPKIDDTLDALIVVLHTRPQVRLPPGRDGGSRQAENCLFFRPGFVAV